MLAQIAAANMFLLPPNRRTAGLAAARGMRTDDALQIRQKRPHQFKDGLHNGFPTAFMEAVGVTTSQTSRRLDGKGAGTPGTLQA